MEGHIRKRGDKWYYSFEAANIDDKRRRIDHKVITPDEFEMIIEKSPAGTTFHIPIMIGYYTGCRIGEVMDWKNLN